MLGIWLLLQWFFGQGSLPWTGWLTLDFTLNLAVSNLFVVFWVFSLSFWFRVPFFFFFCWVLLAYVFGYWVIIWLVWSFLLHMVWCCLRSSLFWHFCFGSGVGSANVWGFWGCFWVVLGLGVPFRVYGAMEVSLFVMYFCFVWLAGSLCLINCFLFWMQHTSHPPVKKPRMSSSSELEVFSLNILICHCLWCVFWILSYMA